MWRIDKKGDFSKYDLSNLVVDHFTLDRDFKKMPLTLLKKDKTAEKEYPATFKTLKLDSFWAAVYVLAFFSVNLIPLLFWKSYLEKHAVAPSLQKAGPEIMKLFLEDYKISKREEEVIQKLCAGRTNKESPTLRPKSAKKQRSMIAIKTKLVKIRLFLVFSILISFTLFPHCPIEG